jgi:hypothetical protein
VTTERSLLLAALLPLSVLLGFACRTPLSQTSAFIDESRIPQQLQGDYESFTSNCSKCHSLARAYNAQVRDVTHWDLYVARMMRTAGSAISPHEAPKILRFLHWYTSSYVMQEKAEATSGSEAALALPPNPFGEEPAVDAPAETPAAAAEAPVAEPAVPPASGEANTQVPAGVTP